MTWILLFLLSFCAYVFKTGPMSAIVILLAFIVACFGGLSLIKHRQFLSFLFVVVYLLMFFPNPFLVSLDVFPLEMPSEGLYSLTNVMLIFGLMLFLLGTNLSKPDVTSQSNVRIYLSRPAITIILGMLFVLASVGIVLLILFGGGLAALRASRADLAAGQYGVWIRVVGLYMFFPFLLAAPLLIIQLSKPLQTVPWIITIALLIVNFFLFRARTPLVTALASIATGVLLKNRILFVHGQPSIKLFQKFRDYLSVVILGICIMIGGIAMNFLRGYVSEGGITLTQGYMNVWIEKSFDGGDFGYQKVQRAAFQLYPNPNPYLMGQSYYRILFVPMPRFIVPNKPENTSRVFCAAIDPALYATGGTIPPGVVGDLYINFGYLGVFGMFFYGLIFGREKYFKFWQWLMLGAAIGWLAHFVRGEFTNSLVTLFVYMMIAMVLERILRPDYEIEETELMEEEPYGSEYPIP